MKIQRREVTSPKGTPVSKEAGAAAPAQPAWQPKGADGPGAPAAQRPALERTPLPTTSRYGAAGFERLLDQTTRSRATDGNRVTMLFDGVQSFAERNRMIDGAKSSINLQTFIFTSDDTGWDLARRLAKKAQEGVQVRVIYDGVGSNRSGSEIFDFMKKAGVEVREYGDPLRQFWDVNDRWHEKHLIVDGKASVEGGMNIANEYALGGSGKLVASRGKVGTEPWRDVDLKLEGPSVRDAQEAFLKNWKDLGPDVPAAQRAKLFPKLEPLPQAANVRAVQARPDEEGQPNVDALYLHAINAAQKSITIENAYFVPPKGLREALIAAAKRGVEVKVMTNSRASNDFGAVSDCGRYFYDEMIAAGVKIFEKQGGTLHSKTATFDGQYSIVGSANLNGRSKGRDSEFVLAIKDPSTARQLEQRFSSGVSNTRAVTAQELAQEGLFTNLKQWALSTLAWTF